MKLFFVYHATSKDNENGIASGWKDVELSERGIQESIELGTTFSSTHLDLVCCSDLKRAVDTTRMAFGDRIDTIIDRRLREINYGDYNGKPKKVIDEMKKGRIIEPFPNGESYEQAVNRIEEFLREVRENFPEKTILVIGHLATRYGLETLINDKTIEECINTPFMTQPYWEYEI